MQQLNAVCYLNSNYVKLFLELTQGVIENHKKLDNKLRWKQYEKKVSIRQYGQQFADVWMGSVLISFFRSELL